MSSNTHTVDLLAWPAVPDALALYLIVSSRYIRSVLPHNLFNLAMRKALEQPSAIKPQDRGNYMPAMNPLNQLKLRYKIILLISVPLITLSVIASLNISQLKLQQDDSKRYSELVTLSAHSSALLHELQKERGASAGFIGSQGKKFSSQLSDQRRLSDSKLLSYQSYLKSFDASAYGEDF